MNEWLTKLPIETIPMEALQKQAQWPLAWEIWPALPVVEKLEQMASDRPFCTKDSVTIALKEIPKYEKVWFGGDITSLPQKKQVMNDL